MPPVIPQKLARESGSQLSSAFLMLRSGRALVASLRLRLALGIGILWLMTAKPDLIGSLLILGVAAAVGLIAGLIAGHCERGRRAHKVEVGAVLAARELETVSGERISVPEPGQLVHLQLRRFAGCPVCNLHLRSFVKRQGEIAAAGIREVVVFHSPAKELVRYAADLPFAVVADPDKRLYAELGAEAGVRALLDPRAWLPIIRAVLLSLWGTVRRGCPVPPVTPAGGRFGLPADFLIASDGRVIARKYGDHVYDQWSVDEVIGRHHTRGEGRSRPRVSRAGTPTATRTSPPGSRRTDRASGRGVSWPAQGLLASLPGSDHGPVLPLRRHAMTAGRKPIPAT